MTDDRLTNTPEPFVTNPGAPVRVDDLMPGARAWLALQASGRHFSTVHVVKYFAWRHLAAGPLQDVSERFGRLALDLIATIADSPELTVALRKLVESKDCAVRAMVDELAGD